MRIVLDKLTTQPVLHSHFDLGSNLVNVASGNVGIGTTSPGAKLDLVTSVNDDGMILTGSGIGGPWVSLKATNGTNNLRYTGLSLWNNTTPQWQVSLRVGDGLLHFYDVVNSLDRMVINASGNVGIGTIGPGAKFHVVIPYAKTDTTRRIINRFGSNDASGDFGLSMDMTGAAALANRSIGIQTADSGIADGGNLALQPIAGNVGIGTTGPGSKLDVAGTVNVAGTVRSTTQTVLSSGTGAELIYAGTFASLIGYDRTASQYKDLRLNDQITVLGGASPGNVGIGTTNPAAQLHVFGGGIISSSQAINAGVTAISGTAGIYTATDNSANANQVAITYGAHNYGASFAAYKTRSTGTDANTIVLNNDRVLTLIGRAADGASYQPVAFIALEVDGTPGASDMPGRIVFNTTLDGSVTLAERMRIDNQGNVGIGTTAPTNILSLGGNSARIFWLERHTTANTAGNSLTIQAGGATSGATDKTGGDLILAPGLSTGTGNTKVRLQAATKTTSTGTADNSLIDRLVITGSKTLTDAATSLFDIALSAGQMTGGVVMATIEASDGTDHQAYTQVITYAAVNKGGVYTTTVTANANNDAKAVSAGTLTTSWALATGTNKVTLQVTPTGSLTETTYRVTYMVINNSPQAITIL